MASPNVKVDKAVKIRRRHTLPGPLHKIRHPSALYRRSCTDRPPVTTASNTKTTTMMTTTQWHHLHQSKTNPYVGWFRHAPSLSSMSSPASLPNASSLGMKSVNLDTLWLRNWLVDGMNVNHQHKKRRIVVNDRNFAEFKYQQDHKIKSTLLVQLQHVMEHRTDTTRDLNLDLLLMYKRRSGHLRGGGRDDTKNDGDDDKNKDIDDSTIEQYLQRQYASSTESITIKALSRIACWLLDIPVYPSTATASVLSSLKESRIDNIEEVGSILSYEDDDDESRSVCSYDNHDTVSGSRFRTSLTNSTDHDNVNVNHHHHQQQQQQPDDDTEERYPVGHGLSSQAEAYYALGAVYRHILAESSPNMSHSDMLRLRSDSVNDIDRLDYEITQMDIVRMNRIASRHLDVESIVRLPVLTYPPKHTSRQRVASGTSGVHTIPEDREPVVSLSTRPESRENVNPVMLRQRNEEHVEKHDAEFSWMLVPPTLDDDDDSFGYSSMEPDTATNSGHLPSQAQHVPPVASHPEHDREDDNAITVDDVCVICLESFIPGDRLRLLPCTHSFHVGCIDRWLSGSHSFHDCYTAGCPTCKVRPDTTAARPDTMSPAAVTTAFPSVSSSPLQLHESDGSVPSWALARIGHILAQESQHF